MDNQLFIVGEVRDKKFLEDIRDQWSKKEDDVLVVFADQLYLYWEILINADRLIIAFSTEVNNDFYNLSLGRLQNGKRSINLLLNPIQLNIEQKFVIGRNKTIFKDLYNGKVTKILENIIKIKEAWDPIPEFILPPDINIRLQQTQDNNLIPPEYYEEHPKSKIKLIGPIIIAIAIILVGIVFWLYREGYIGANRPVEPAVPLEEGPIEMKVVEEMPPENTAESTDQIQGISVNDIVYLSGKIDAKYPVHMILDLRQRIGGYYYDKYGSSNFIGVDIPQLRSLGDGRWLITLSISTANGDVDEEWHGPLTYEKFTGNGLYLGKEMPFDLDVDSVITESKDPLIEKVHANGANWKSCVFDGDVTGGGKVFKVKITAQTNQKGEFKDANYHNLSYNVSFPVDVRINGEHLYITGKSGHSDFRIEATSQGGGYEGNMYSDGKSLTITLGRPTL